jgi:hypothetical protein
MELRQWVGYGVGYGAARNDSVIAYHDVSCTIILNGVTTCQQFHTVVSLGYIKLRVVPRKVLPVHFVPFINPLHDVTYHRKSKSAGRQQQAKIYIDWSIFKPDSGITRRDFHRHKTTVGAIDL